MIEQRTLPNGVRIIAEPLNSVRSVSVGIWVANGSRYEAPEVNGISHFIEHMLFKGTPTRSAAQIAAQMDRMGGQGNAFTSKECTCYYMRVMDTHVRQAGELLADMLLNANCNDADINLERGVVLEEIDMYEDSPEDVAVDRLFESCFADCALGRPILGTAQTLANMNHDTLRAFLASNYRPEDIVIALSGSFTPADLDYIASLFTTMTGTGRNTYTPAVYTPKTLLTNKEIEQNHLCLAFEGLPAGHENRYVYQMMYSMLGGGMSSRLFQTIREQQGLCYSIYTFPSNHLDCGMLSVYAGTGRGQEIKVLQESARVISEFCAHGATADELECNRDQLKCSLLMSLESTSARMMQLGRALLLQNKVFDADLIAQRIDTVTLAQVQEMAQSLFDFNRASVSVVGKPAEQAVYADILGAYCG